MSSLKEKEILMKKINLIPEIIKKIVKFDCDFHVNKIMNDLSIIINNIHNEEKLIQDLIQKEYNNIVQEDEFLQSYLLEGDIYELEILDESEPRKNINKYLEMIVDYFEKNKSLTNTIIKEYFELDMEELIDCDILTLCNSQYIINEDFFDKCHNIKFVNFLFELNTIFTKWSIDYCDEMYIEDC